MTQTLELLNNDFKQAILNMLYEVKEYRLKVKEKQEISKEKQKRLK